MSNFRTKLKLNDGFTLVELMVVVAIIGLLSAVAIPNFKKYQAKAKTSEAKLQLASTYTAQTSWFSDYDNFSTCLNLMGYDPAVENLTRYYAVGFASANTVPAGAATANGAPAACVVAGVVNDTTTLATAATDTFAWGAGKRVGGTVMVGSHTAQTATATVAATGDQFITTAIGVIDATKNTSVLADRWTINENKKITSIVIGY